MDSPAPNLSTDELAALVREHYGIEFGGVKALDGYDDRNYHLTDINVTESAHEMNRERKFDNGLVLKITNHEESAMPMLAEAHASIMQHVHAHGVQCATPVLLKNGSLLTRISRKTQTADNSNDNDASGVFAVRLVDYLPGQLLLHAPLTCPIMFECGQLLAKFRLATQFFNFLQSFTHAGYRNFRHRWSLTTLAEVEEKSTCIADDWKRKLVEQVIREYKQRVEPIYATLPSGIIHSDFNEANVLVSRDPTTSEYHVSGLLDFGDTHLGPWLIDFTNCVLYLMLLPLPKNVPFIEVGGHVLSGYNQSLNPAQRLNQPNSLITLSTNELHLSRICMLARLCQSLVFGWYTYQRQPQNAAYLLKTQENGWQLMKALLELTDEKLVDTWLRVAANVREK